DSLPQQYRRAGSHLHRPLSRSAPHCLFECGRRGGTNMTSPAIQRALLPVLLIEDEPSIMALVSATLERNGYQVACIESGAEALRLLEKGQYLGVVSDMRTPGGVDGAQAHSWISAN